MSFTGSSETCEALRTEGLVWIRGPFARVEDAWEAAGALLDPALTAGADIEIIGEFVLPPPDGPPSRDFQTLHIDFGLPLIPGASADVARFTALHVAVDAATVQAATRLVSLRGLLGAARWPDRGELLRRFAAYGDSHGAWEDEHGYVEGSLARIVEAALGQPPALPSVKTTAGFRCGLEFARLADERAFFAERGLPLDAAETEVTLAPGQLLVFDNLAVAHGRRGRRQPGELNQRIYGHRALPPSQQAQLRDRALTALWERNERRIYDEGVVTESVS
jgi:hypothetical protein